MSTMSQHRREGNQMIAAFNRNCDIAARPGTDTKIVTARGIAIDQAIALQDRMHQLEADIDECWDWLDNHSDHPEYEALDEQVADMIREHADIAGALEQGWNRWFTDRSQGPVTTGNVKRTPESLKANARAREWNDLVFQRAKEAKEAKEAKKAATRRKRKATESNHGIEQSRMVG